MSALLHIAYRRTRRADDRMLSRLLKLAGLCPLSALGGEVEAMLRQRMSDCRDLFALRGVRPKRLTVLRLTGRRIAQDAECFEQMARLSARHGPDLLRAVCALMEMVGQSGFPKAQPEPVSPTKAPMPVATPVPQAANDPDPTHGYGLEGAIVALKRTNLMLHDAAVVVLRPSAAPQLLAA